MSINMSENHENVPTSIAHIIFQPKMLLALLFVWVLVVAVGSSVAIYATQYTILSDTEVEAILSENERLALTAGVQYSDSSNDGVRQMEVRNVEPVYPDRLVIPSLNKDLPVSNPQTRNIAALDEELKSAVVRYPDSATLGEEGRNTLIFGHSSRLPVVRNQLYKAFTGIEKLESGDLIQAYSGSDVYSYRVSRVYRADANDDRIELSVPGANRLTLLTCDTFGKRSDRWIVEADLIGKNT